MDQAAIAAAHAEAFGKARPLPLVSGAHPEFSVADGYRIAHLIRDLREARGERVAGRKIGGTNPALYHLTGATGPSWNFMYATTMRELPDGGGTFAVGAFPQSQIEPELVLHLAAPPRPGMSEAELLACVDRVAAGFEFVFSPYGVWPVAPADAAAGFGLHQAALIGPWQEITRDRQEWAPLLRTCEVTLAGSNGEVRHGTGANAFGSPVLALKAIVDAIGANPGWSPIAAGEIVTTGTLTDLMPARPGETWAYTVAGAPLRGLSVTLT